MAAIFYPIIYFLIVISPLAVILLTGPYTDHGMPYELGKAFAFTGFIIIALQFVLSSRRKWIERHYGLDMIFSYHKALAVLAGVLILGHPVLLSLGLGNFQLLTSLSLPWYIWLGKAALVLILIQIIVSGFRINLHLGFEKWRFSHNIIGGLLLVGAFTHAIATSHSDLDITAVQVLFTAIPVTGLFFYIHHKVILPARLKKNAYTISAVQQQTHNVWTLEMRPPQGQKRYSYRPGQFHFIKLHRNKGLPEEEHHFTISSTPTRSETVISTIKESGDFTSTIGSTQKGDQVSIEAPFGRFSHLYHPEDKNFVFIAGGIGITPLMSMLRYMRDKETDYNVLLVYANHTQKDIVFRQELDEMTKKGHPKLEIIHVLDDPDETWEGETGFVDDQIVSKYVDNFDDKAFYLCCPPPMRKAVLKILKEKSVPNDRIRVEIFSL
ncbi:oxidoreductase [candidate division KSB1 bacterium]|nr:oxidoreductase [candidate division KSB1 bacterium]